GLPWIKTEGDLITPHYGIGYWLRGCSEPLLIGRRGDATLPSAPWIGLLSPVLEHSRKPESVYQYAEDLPGPYAELFARERRDGWDSYGDAIDGLDIREALARKVAALGDGGLTP